MKRRLNSDECMLQIYADQGITSDSDSILQTQRSCVSRYGVKLKGSTTERSSSFFPLLDCGDLIKALEECHNQGYFSRLMGSCNGIKHELNMCLREEVRRTLMYSEMLVAVSDVFLSQ